MQETMKMRTWSMRVLALMAAVVLLAGVARAQDAAAAAQRTDGQIEMDVVHALDASEALKNDLITAATISSKVTLSGTVTSEDSKQLAERIVKGVPGVTGVVNNLKIGNPANDPNAQNAPMDEGDVADSGPVGAAQDQGPQGQQQAQNMPQEQTAQGYPQPDQQQAQPYPQQGQAQQYPQQNTQPYPQQPAYGQAPPPAYSQPGYGAPPTQQGAYRGQYAPAPPPPNYRYAAGPVMLPAGTLLQVRTNEAVASKRAQGGQPVEFTVIQDVTVGGVLAIPRGATVHGVIADVKRAESGTLTGSAELALQLTGLDLGGQSYPLQSDEFRIKGPGKGERSAGNIIGGALLGAIIGGAAGGGSGAAIGAAAGGTVGTAASAATRGPEAWIPAEALVSFHLATPVTVNPVSQQEAMRLAQGLYPGGPTLYRRGYYGRPYGYPQPYFYAPVYYRPYYMVGGVYYWR